MMNTQKIVSYESNIFGEGATHLIPKKVLIVVGLDHSVNNNIIQEVTSNSSKILVNQLKLTTEEVQFPELRIDYDNGMTVYNYSPVDIKMTNVTNNDNCAKAQQALLDLYFLKNTIDYADSIGFFITISDKQLCWFKIDLDIDGCFDQLFNFLLNFQEIFNLNKKYKDAVMVAIDITENLGDFGDPDIILTNYSVEGIIEHFDNRLNTFVEKFQELRSQSDDNVLNISEIFLKNGSNKIRFFADYKAEINSRMQFINNDKSIFRNNKISSFKFIRDDCFMKIINEVINPVISENFKQVFREIVKDHDAAAGYAMDFINTRSKFSAQQQRFLDSETKAFEFPSHLLGNFSIGSSSQIKIYHSIVEDYDKYLKFLTAIKENIIPASYRLNDLCDTLRAEPLSSLTEYFFCLRIKTWDEFLEAFETSLSSYFVQTLRKQHVDNVTQLIHLSKSWDDKITNSEQNKKLFSIVNDILQKQNIWLGQEYHMMDYLKEANINKASLFALSKMLNELFFSKEQDAVKYNGNKLQITGQFLKLSEVKKYPSAKEIELLASNRIYIDTDLKRTGDEVRLSIIAPTWEVVSRKEIILDGANATAHDLPQMSISLGKDGYHGKPGKAGGPAGSFLGIGLHFINMQSLAVSVRGGMGGPGQSGADGTIGYNGRKQQVSEDDHFESKYDCERLAFPTESAFSNDILIKNFNIFSNYKCRTRKTCTNGGNAGMGGAGGKGGKTGGAKLIAFQEKIDMKMYVSEGNDGPAGKHGKAADGGSDQLIEFKVEYGASQYGGFKVMGSTKRKKIQITNLKTENIKCKSGLNYETGIVNMEGRTEPKLSNARISVNVINDYKSYARKNLSKKIAVNKYLRILVDKIENNIAIQDLYDAIGLIHDTDQLENQYYELKEDLDFLPLYQSLLDRTMKYANEYYKENSSITDEKIALSYLYTAIWGRINRFLDKKSSKLILNIETYLKSVMKNVHQLTDYSKISQMNILQKQYYDSINGNIKTALAIIPDIVQESEALILELDKNFDKLLNETTKSLKKVENQKEEARELEKEMNDALTARLFLTVPKTVGKFLNVLGPYGQFIGAAISESASAADSFYQAPFKKDSPKLVKLPKGVEYVLQTEENLKEEQDKFKLQLGAVVQEFDQVSNQHVELPKSIEIFKNALFNLTKLMEEKSSKSSLDAYKIKEAELLKSGKWNLMKESTTNDAQKQNLEKIFSRAEKYLSMIDLPFNLFLSVLEDEQKIKNVRQFSREADKQINNLEKYRDNVLKIIIPQCKNLQMLISESQNNEVDATHATLVTKKWKVLNTLKNIQHEIFKSITDFEVHQDIPHIMDNLKDALSTMIDVYNTIEDYRDKQKLANYIKQAIEITRPGIQIETFNLKRAIDDLQVTVQSNLVLEQGDEAISAFKQYVYPLAEKYLLDISRLNFSNSIDDPNQKTNKMQSLVADTQEQLKVLTNRIQASKMILEDQVFDFDAYEKESFTVNNDNIGPFYVWNYAENKYDISRLLAGKEVILKTDIMKGSKFNAVKFREIFIRFVFANETATEDKGHFYKDMASFNLEMVHLGNSHYKCGDKYHIIKNNNITIRIDLKSFKGNRVFTELQKHKGFYSPYAWWKVLLVKKFGHNITPNLSKYENMTINLALEGKGDYYDNTEEFNQVCIHASQYYKEDDTISKKNTTDEEFTHEISKVKEQENQRRKRRSTDDREPVTSSSTSNMKSSFINNIFNLIGTGWVAYVDPANKISNWFTKCYSIINQEDPIFLPNNVPSNLKLSSIRSLESTNLPNLFLGNESPINNNVYGESLFCSHGNLLLIDLLIRSKTGMKYNHESFACRTNFDSQYAQNLAYRKYTK